ncbi:MAG: HAD family hydrolase, partial [Planctomycetales bacterium]
MFIPSASIAPPLRLAMWSGPRNISTAMMRAWGNREDTFVCDEPLYACYLKTTGKPHPVADEVIAHQESDWRRVVDWLTGEIPEGKRIFYQKQMTHHLLPEIDRGWLTGVTNCFLIRDPREVITSYIAKNDDPALEDLGFVQQGEIFDVVRRQTGQAPLVLDARDIQEDPRRMLGLLCDALKIDFTPNMLSWPPGLRPT